MSLHFQCRMHVDIIQSKVKTPLVFSLSCALWEIRIAGKTKGKGKGKGQRLSFPHGGACEAAVLRSCTVTNVINIQAATTTGVECSSDRTSRKRVRSSPAHNAMGFTFRSRLLVHSTFHSWCFKKVVG